MSIPLIQDNQKDSINASLIAIKREEERLQALIAEADEKIAQLNELKVSKSDIVDEVTSGNMQSVTSNAVAEKLGDYVKNSDINNLRNYLKTDRGTSLTYSGMGYSSGFICAVTANVGSGLYYFTCNRGISLTKLAGSSAISATYSNEKITITGYGNNVTRITMIYSNHP